MPKAILNSQKNGILVLGVDAGRASIVDIIARHAAMYSTATLDARHIRDTRYERTILAFGARLGQWSDTAATYKQCK
jgi:hypothetical protein